MRDEDALAAIRSLLAEAEGKEEFASMVYKGYLIASDLTSDESKEFRKVALPFFRQQYETLPEDSELRPYCAVLLHYCMVSACVNPSSEDDGSSSFSGSAEPLRYAASKNLPHAYYRLGDLASSGVVSEDTDGDYYRMAAEMGHLPSYMALGFLHSFNIFQKSEEKAKYYYTLAANMGYERARAYLAELEKENKDDSSHSDDNNDNYGDFGNEDDDLTNEFRAKQEQYKNDARQAIQAVTYFHLSFDFAGTWPLFERARAADSKATTELEDRLTEAETRLYDSPGDDAIALEVMVYKAYIMASLVDPSNREKRNQVFPFLMELSIELPATLEEAKMRSMKFNEDRKFYLILLYYCYHKDWQFKTKMENEIAVNGFTAVSNLQLVLDQDTLLHGENTDFESLVFMASSHAACAMGLSLFYEYNSTSPDIEQGLSYLKMAVDKYGNVEACFNLGQIYQYGGEVAKNEEEAKRLYLLGISKLEQAKLVGLESHVVSCMNTLAAMYVEDGDTAEALRWYHRLVDDFEDLNIIYMLGTAYWRDDGYLSPCIETKDLVKAEQYLLRAAEKDHGEAQSMLGTFYCEVKENYEEGAKWYEKAAANYAYGVYAKLDDLYERGLVPRPN